MLFRSVYVTHAHACLTTKTLFLFLFLQNFKRWRGRVIWSNFLTFFCLAGKSRVQGPESSPAFFNRICLKYDMTSRQDNTAKRRDDMMSRQDDMTNSIMESRPIETFASKCKFVCQSKSLLFVDENYYCGDNRRTKGIRKIKLCALKVCCVTNQLQHFS